MKILGGQPRTNGKHPPPLRSFQKAAPGRGGDGGGSLRLPLPPSSRCPEQEQPPSLCLWPAPSWHFLALSWLPGLAPARCPLQGQRALGPRAQARPSRDWNRPAHPWQRHCGRRRKALVLRSERGPLAPPPSTFWMTSAPCSMPWLTSWMPCWTEWTCQEPSTVPSVPCSGPCLSPGTEAAPAALAGSLLLLRASSCQHCSSRRQPHGSRRDLSEPDLSAKPPPECNPTGRPCPLDRDPGKSFLPRKKAVVAGLLGCFLCPCIKALWPPAVLSRLPEEAVCLAWFPARVHGTCK